MSLGWKDATWTCNNTYRGLMVYVPVRLSYSTCLSAGISSIFLRLVMLVRTPRLRKAPQTRYLKAEQWAGARSATISGDIWTSSVLHSDRISCFMSSPKHNIIMLITMLFWSIWTLTVKPLKKCSQVWEYFDLMPPNKFSVYANMILVTSYHSRGAFLTDGSKRR